MEEEEEEEERLKLMGFVGIELGFDLEEEEMSLMEKERVMKMEKVRRARRRRGRNITDTLLSKSEKWKRYSRSHHIQMRSKGSN